LLSVNGKEQIMIVNKLLI